MLNCFYVTAFTAATWKIAEACGYTLVHLTVICGRRPFWLNPCRCALGVSLPHPSSPLSHHTAVTQFKKSRISVYIKHFKAARVACEHVTWLQWITAAHWGYHPVKGVNFSRGSIKVKFNSLCCIHFTGLNAQFVQGPRLEKQKEISRTKM